MAHQVVSMGVAPYRVVLLVCAAAVMASPWVLPLRPALAQTAGTLAQGASAYSPQQLDALLAPVALYPDDLLTQVLMASAQPLQVVAAARWVGSPANARLRGDALAAVLQPINWDPAVKSLVPFPAVLKQMNDQLDWTQQLGYAFATQQADVLDAVQRLRAQAQATGHLSTTRQQVVQVDNGAIVIAPANPQVVYVPAYNPTVVYGAWPTPDYPPVYLPPPPGYDVGGALVTGMAFGAGAAIVGSLWGLGRPNWGGGDVTVNTNRWNSINGDSSPISNSNWTPPDRTRSGGWQAPTGGPVGQPNRNGGLTGGRQQGGQGVAGQQQGGQSGFTGGRQQGGQSGLTGGQQQGGQSGFTGGRQQGGQSGLTGGRQQGGQGVAGQQQGGAGGSAQRQPGSGVYTGSGPQVGSGGGSAQRQPGSGVYTGSGPQGGSGGGSAQRQPGSGVYTGSGPQGGTGSLGTTGCAICGSAMPTNLPGAGSATGGTPQGKPTGVTAPQGGPSGPTRPQGGASGSNIPQGMTVTGGGGSAKAVAGGLTGRCSTTGTTGIGGVHTGSATGTTGRTASTMTSHVGGTTTSSPMSHATASTVRRTPTASRPSSAVSRPSSAASHPVSQAARASPQPSHQATTRGTQPKKNP